MGEPRRKVVKRELFVKHSPEEQVALNERLATAVDDVGRLEAGLKETVVLMRSKIKMVKEARDQAVADITKRGALRQVEVEIIYDYHHNTDLEKRLDTEEIIAQRALTAEECQIGLDLDGGEKAA